MSEQLSVAKILEDELKAINSDLQTLQSELVRLNGELSRAKWGKRGGIKKSIKNLEQQISKRTKDRRLTQENLSEAMLAVAGIDQDSGKAGAIGGSIASGLTSVASIVGSVMGAPNSPNVSQLAGAQQLPEQTRELNIQKGLFDKREEEKPKQNNMLYIIIGAVALLFLMMKKK
jgi:hypothetical protein